LRLYCYQRPDELRFPPQFCYLVNPLLFGSPIEDRYADVCKVVAAEGLLEKVQSAVAKAPNVWPSDSRRFISEIFSSSGHPASSTPCALRLNAPVLSLSPCAQESLPCGWQTMQ